MVKWFEEPKPTAAPALGDAVRSQECKVFMIKNEIFCPKYEMDEDHWL
jgi:hypothetical protein